MLRRAIETPKKWDFLVIGGGATGVGVAVDAASRGYSALLLEQNDFGKGTSSRSTKLVHGGVRYLQQGNIPLVMDALRERGRLRRNAPHLVQDLEFVVPNYVWWEAPFYGIGMKVYDALAGKYGFGKSGNLSKEETVQRLPTIEVDGLRGGVVYHDGQFDDARLLLDLAQTAAGQGATLLNYCRVVELEKDQEGYVTGLVAIDEETGQELRPEARVVVNATGVFTDEIRRLDDPSAPGMIRPSQGVHLVLPREFLGGSSAIMVPHTDDGRVLFAIPWHNVVIVGTTDTPVSEDPTRACSLPRRGGLSPHSHRTISHQRPHPGRRSVVFRRAEAPGEPGRGWRYGFHLQRSHPAGLLIGARDPHRWQVDDLPENGRGRCGPRNHPGWAGIPGVHHKGAEHPWIPHPPGAVW